MSKGDDTKEKILELTAPLFNQKGFFGASLSDVMAVTGLKKGGIYNHFGSKDELALEAFDYATSLVAKRTMAALECKTGAVEKLLAFCHVFLEICITPVVEGGCPLMNTAIESDDAHPALRERARRAMDNWMFGIKGIVSDGIESGELRAEVSPDVIATRMIATLEGGTMLSRLYGDPVYVRQAADFVEAYILNELAS